MLRVLVIFLGVLPLGCMAQRQPLIIPEQPSDKRPPESDARTIPVHFPGVDHTLVQSLHNKNGVNCCNAADATMKDPDWGIKDGTYWVFIAGARRDVHPSAVVITPNPTNHALVWFVYMNGEPTIKCFMPGHLT
jgi:hypothetical protein